MSNEAEKFQQLVNDIQDFVAASVRRSGASVAYAMIIGREGTRDGRIVHNVGGRNASDPAELIGLLERAVANLSDIGVNIVIRPDLEAGKQ